MDTINMPIHPALALLLLTFTSPVIAQDGALAGGQDRETDSVVVAASQQYADRSLMNRLLMGKNYREAWSTPVKLPALYLSRSGFTIESLGGGMQTKSLRLKDAHQASWVLRTVDKD